jgi:hypothetical protein
MTRDLLFRLARMGALCGALTLLCIVAVPSATAFAAEGRIFNPALSLTGKCLEPGVVPDPIPDPGCPGGAHPPKPFAELTSVTTDSYGDMYVASFGHNSFGSEGRIDIFNPKGFFISELSVPPELEPPSTVGPRNLAVDSKGNLYVYTFLSGSEERGSLHRCSPAVPYEPAAGNVKYDRENCKVLAKGNFVNYVGLEIDREDHLFAWEGESLTEYGSAAEGNVVLETNIGGGDLDHGGGAGLAIDLSRKRMYVYDEKGSSYVIKVLELEKPHALLETIDGSTTPAGKFHSSFTIAVDEGTGHVFVFDSGYKGSEAIYELTKSGEYLSSIDYELAGNSAAGSEIAIDNGKNSPNGVLNPFGVRFLFVPVHGNPSAHTFAFGPQEPCPPVIEASSFTGVSESEAELQAKIEPCSLETSYSFEYTTEESFEEEGFADAQVAGQGQIPAGLAPVSVSAPADGLAPGTAYHFRVFAENEKGPVEAEGEFATYPSQPLPECPNDALRTGFSELLPDCRAYELVTPPDTNARSPIGMGWLGVNFTGRHASPSGNKVSFLIEGGLIPGSEGTGSLGGDTYLATRGENGWRSSLAGPKGAEVEAILPGNTSPDQGYSFWSNVLPVENYVRYPDGHSALVGRGSLASDPRADGKLISENGDHIIFSSGTSSPAVQLEEKAPPDGTKAVYDRTADEVTHVVSLLPGGVPPAKGEDATYQSASLDGKGVAFTIGKKLYLRFDDEETYEIGENVTLAGVAEGGARIFYVEGGDLFAFDAETEEAVRFTESGDVTPVNVAADGTAAYFVSPSALTGGEENPNGDTAQPGKENLYLSREGAINFVGTVTKGDVEGEELGTEARLGLGRWTDVVGGNLTGMLALDTSRTTPDGSALLFESRASLTGYDPEGHLEVYRYDSVNGELDCISCNPTLAPATGEARLQSISPARFEPEPLTPYDVVANLRADGRRAFFQSTEALVPGDTDELQDVYEWEAEGIGSCTNPGGCVYLISSGHSDRIDYLYAVSDDGDNAFFRSSDLLLALDTEHTPSVYDARVEGGFAEEEPIICQSEGCKPPLTAPPLLPTPESGVHEPEEGSPPVKHCPKGKHKVTKNGKTSCVKKKHRKASPKKKGGSK